MRHVLEHFVSAGLMPSVAGKSVWDLGCGEAQFSAAFAELDASHVYGSDLQHSERWGALSAQGKCSFILGDCTEAGRVWGNPLPVDIVFVHLVTEHVYEPRSFFHELSSVLKPGTTVLLHHDNFYQPVGHHDHGLLFLDEASWKVVPQGVACWDHPRKCEFSQEHRSSLAKAYHWQWSDSGATRNPSNCSGCNYFKRSQPWAHLIYKEDARETFPEQFFKSHVNRMTIDQLLWYVQEAGFQVENERPIWIGNEPPEDLIASYGRDNLTIFTHSMRLTKLA